MVLSAAVPHRRGAVRAPTLPSRGGARAGAAGGGGRGGGAARGGGGGGGGGGLLALGFALRRVGSRWVVAAALTSPAVVFAVVAGQVSLLVAAILLSVFAQLDRRPVRAGLLLSLLVIKPQTIILVPVLLMSSRRWRVLASAAFGTAAIVAASVAVNGLTVWTRFIDVGLPAQVAEMRDTIHLLAKISVSLTTAAIETGLSAATASWLQLAATLAAVAIVCWVGWRSRKAGPNTDYECLVVLTCSIFASPYFLLHDLAAFSAAAIVLASRGMIIGNRWGIIAIVYAPLLQPSLALLHVHIMPLLALGFAGLLVARGRMPRRRVSSESNAVAAIAAPACPEAAARASG